MCTLRPFQVDLVVRTVSEASVAEVHYCNEVAALCCYSNDNCQYDLYFLRPLAFDFDNEEVVGPAVDMHEKDNFDFHLVDLLNKVTM